jgi:hypothetical protein
VVLLNNFLRGKLDGTVGAARGVTVGNEDASHHNQADDYGDQNCGSAE